MSSGQRPTTRQLETAFFEGLNGVDGDPEALREMGIPVDGDDFESHVTAGRTLRGRLAGNVGKVCGDCCITVSPGDACVHLQVNNSGQPRIIG
jgi:hypothetical protein